MDGGPRENKLVQNALIGQQDISKFYQDTTTKQIFSKVSKLCEIGEYLLFIAKPLWENINILSNMPSTAVHTFGLNKDCDCVKVCPWKLT